MGISARPCFDVNFEVITVVLSAISHFLEFSMLVGQHVRIAMDAFFNVTGFYDNKIQY